MRRAGLWPDTRGMEIEILFYRSDVLQSRATAPDADSALLAARTLWDDDREAWPIQGAEKTRRVVLQHGDVCGMFEGRRP